MGSRMLLAWNVAAAVGLVFGVGGGVGGLFHFIDVLERLFDMQVRPGVCQQASLNIYRTSVYVAGMRLNELRFLILAALAKEPLHGYALAEEIELLSAGHHTPRPGALYHAIDKLSEGHLVELDREETVEGRVRRYYRLTESGQATVTAEAQRRSQAAAAALDRITQINPAT